MLQDLDGAHREADINERPEEAEGDAVEIVLDGHVVIEGDLGLPPLANSYGVGCNGRRAGRSSVSQSWRRVPSRFWNGRSFNASRSAAIASFASATLVRVR
jgi:hypothetical protein